MVNKHYPQCTFLQWMIRKRPYLCHLLYVADIKLLQFIQTMTFQIRMQTVTSPTTAVIQRSSINEVHSKALHVVSLCHLQYLHVSHTFQLLVILWGFVGVIFPLWKALSVPIYFEQVSSFLHPTCPSCRFCFWLFNLQVTKLHVSVCHMFPSYMVSVRKAVWIFLNSLICW